MNGRRGSLVVLETGEQDPGAGGPSAHEDPLPGSHFAAFSMSPRDRREALWGPLYEDTNPIREGSTPRA